MNTKRKGKFKRTEFFLRANLRKTTQRFYCHDCKKYFSIRRRPGCKYSEDIYVETIKRHIEDRSGYRIISKRLRETTKTFISKSTVHNYLKQASLSSRSLISIIKEFNPKLTGFLHLDGKGIKVKGKNKWSLTLFIAQDSMGLPIHQDLMEGENKLAVMNFLDALNKDLNYYPRGIISDMREDIIQAVKEKIPQIPHQFCLTHILRGIDRVVKYQPYHTQASKLLRRLKALRSIFVYPYLNKKESLIAEYRQIKQKIKALKARYRPQLLARRYLRIYVLSKTARKAEQRLKTIKKLKTKFQQQRKILNHINLLIKYKDNIFYHLSHSYMPYTNNTLENLIKQYERRLKTIEGFGNNQEIIKGYLNLMAICYCFKSYTDCRKNNKYKNGKSPLEIAGVSTKSLDWVRFALNKRLS